MIKFYNLFFSGYKPLILMFVSIFLMAYFGISKAYLENSVSIFMGILLFNIIVEIFSRTELSSDGGFKPDPDFDNIEVDIVYDIERPGTSI